MSDPRRALPSVSALIESDAIRPLLGRAPRSLVVGAVRGHEAARRPVVRTPRDRDGRAVGHSSRAPSGPLAPGHHRRASLRPNWTRPLPYASIDSSQCRSRRCESRVLRRPLRSRSRSPIASDLRELTGPRTPRGEHCAARRARVEYLCRVTRVVISRGELVEIGGSFRIPDIMAKSGARLVEVGTTNRTHADDYRRAFGPASGAVVKVHRSNFAVEGFVAEVNAEELTSLARECDLPFVHDLGSGLMMSLADYGLTGEPTARDAVRAGATLVTMSGDKLLGASGRLLPNSARAGAVARITRPLRRVDNLTLAALEGTLALTLTATRVERDSVLAC